MLGYALHKFLTSKNKQEILTSPKFEDIKLLLILNLIRTPLHFYPELPSDGKNM
jgi:hypothetical protein